MNKFLSLVIQVHHMQDQLPFQSVDDLYKSFAVEKLDTEFVTTQFELMISKLKQWGCSHRFIILQQLKLQSLMKTEIELQYETPSEKSLKRSQ